MATVVQWQNTGGHNQLSCVQFPAIASFMFFLSMLFENDVTCGLVITIISITHVRTLIVPPVEFTC